MFEKPCALKETLREVDGRMQLCESSAEVFYLTVLYEATYLLSTVLPEGRYMVTFFFFFF